MSGVSLVVESNIFNCSINFDRHIIFIKGDSGTGKTTLANILAEQPDGVRIECSLEYSVLNATQSNIILLSKNTLFIIDDLRFVETREFAVNYKKSVEELNNYFIIIGRAFLTPSSNKGISYSSNDIYKFVSSDNVYGIEKLYEVPVVLDGENTSVDCFLVEDSKSGYTFFKELVDVECKTSNGKSKIISSLEELSKCCDCVFVIFDTASFGCHMEELWTKFNYVYELEVIFMSDYECFEELLLQTNLLRNLESVKIVLSNIVDYANNGYISWEKYYEELLSEVTYGKPFKYSHKRGYKLVKCYLCSCLPPDCPIQRSTKCGNKLDGIDKFKSLLQGTKYERLLEYHEESEG